MKRPKPVWGKLACLVPFLIVLFSAGLSRSDTDIWWHLASGRWIIANGAIPTTDPFTTRAVEWVDYTWLFDVAVYGLYRIGGYGAVLSGFVALYLALTLALQELLDELRADTWFGHGLVILTVAGLSVLMTPRPWAVSILLSTLVVALLVRHRDTGRNGPLVFVPPLFALWANLHIQFVLGLGWIALALAGAVLEARAAGAKTREAARPLLLCLAASAACSLLNPYGPRLYAVAWSFASHPGEFPGVPEMTPPWSYGLRFTWAALALTLLAGADFARSWRARRMRVFSSLLLVAGAAFGLRMIRDLWAFFLGMVVFAADGRAAAQERPAGRSAFAGRRFRAVAAGVALGLNLLFGLFFYGRPLEGALAMRFPAGAALYVAQHVAKGPLFNDIDWGGYLIWALPEHRVALDGRTPVCGPEVFRSTLSAWLGEPGWRDNPDLLAARAVVANRAAPLTRLLRSDERFKATYEDTVAVVFERR